MTFVKLMGEAFPKGRNKIIIPTQFGKKLGFMGMEDVYVKAGLGLPLRAKIAFIDGKDKEAIWLTKDLFQHLNLRRGYSLQAKVDFEKRSVEIGPIFGLFTRRVPPMSKLRDPIKFLQELIRQGKNEGVLTYVFSPQSINWAKSEVEGYLYNIATDEWVKGKFPLPNVVYDRIHSRSAESSKEVQKAKNRLMSLPTLGYFNPRFLDKWECHNYLWKDPEVMPYLPETFQYKSINSLIRFMHKHPVTYLKPSKGSLGRGIIRLSKVGTNQYVCKYRAGGKETLTYKLNGKKVLKEKLRKLISGKPYIMQQGLQLQMFQGAPFDVRILMQKNHKGVWCRTKMLVRVASKGSITSNLSSGASAALFSEVVEKVFKEESNKPGGLGNKLRHLAEIVATALEREMDVPLGELGIDAGVDVYGNVWLIEVNSKPFKAMETEKGSDAVILNSVLRPLGYAKYLWKNDGKSEPEES